MDLYIIGAGDVGGFLAHHLEEVGHFKLRGFIDENVTKHGRAFYSYKVLGGLDFIKDYTKPIAVAIAIADPIAKRNIYKSLEKNVNISFPNFIHSSVWLGKNIKMGVGNIIYPGVVMNYETEICDFVTINMNAAVGHNCYFGSFSTLSPGVNCGGFTKLGERSFFGIGSTSIQAVEIGVGVTIGAGAVIIKDVPDGATVVGNPGRIIKTKSI